MRRGVLLVPMLAVAVLAASCGGGGTESTSTTPAAPTPGPVTLVTHDSFAVSDDVVAAFEAETGIEVRVARSGDAGSMVNQAVLTAGDPVGDVMFGVDNTFLTRALDADVFVPYEAAGLAAVPAAFRVDPQHRVTPVDYGDVCLNYDRAYFRAADLSPPRTLDDLLDPAYRGLTVVEDAALSSPGLAFLLATVARYGEDGWTGYWRSLADNDVLVAPDWESAYYTDFSGGGGGGDRPIVVSYASSPPADVVFADPPEDEPGIGAVTDGCFRQVEMAGVLRGAAHPDRARRVVDWFLSRSFQADVPLQMFVLPVRPGVALPEVFRRWAAVPDAPLTLAPAVIGEHRDEWIRTWTDLVGG